MENGTWIPRTTVEIEGRRVSPYLAADAAFPGGPLLVKPYAGEEHLTDEQLAFNMLLSSNRQIIEQTWGILVNRFRRWRSACEFRGEGWERRVIMCIRACMILHNLCREDEDTALFSDDSGSDSDSDSDDDNGGDDEESATHDAMQLRLCNWVNRLFFVHPTTRRLTRF